MVQKRTYKRLLRTYFLSAFLVGCGCLKTPKVLPKQILTKYKICKEYKPSYGDRLTLKFVRNIPIEECLKDGNWVITTDEFLDIRNKYQETKSCYDDRGEN